MTGALDAATGKASGAGARAALLLGTMLLPAIAAGAQTPAGSVGAPVAAPVSASVAADATTGLQDIIVTAQRRRESAQTVPIAITAFSAGSLEAKNVSSTLQLVQYVPNLFGSNNTGLGSANAYYIRGLGNTESIATFDPPVGTYVDDVYLARQNANNLSFFDVDRVEVLRGPQGTLFGRNTTGGAVNVVLKRPGDVVAGFGEVSYGAYKQRMVRASLDVPLTPGIAFKLSGYYQKDAGYVHDTTTGERLNNQDNAGVRLAARFEITDAISWNASAAYMRNSGTNILNFTCDPNNPSNCNGRFASTGLSRATSSYAPLAIAGEKAGYGLGNRAELQLYTSNIEWRIGEHTTLNFITGVVDLTQKFALDFADGRGLPGLATPVPEVHGYPLGGFTILNNGSNRQVTQEIKLNGSLFDGRFDYVTGFYYFHEKSATDFADIFNLGPVFGIPGSTGFPFLLADRILNNTTNAKAGYFQGDIHVTDTVKVTGGIRYTDEEKSVRFSDNRAECAGSLSSSCLNQSNLVASNGTPIPTSQRAKVWTPRVAVNYQPDSDLLLFASATRGFKSGGWNARGYTADVLLPFGPEKAWSYEIGLKSEFFEHRLRVNLTAFYLDTTDLQTPSAAVAPNGTVSFITQNFANYHNRGLELEVTALPIDNLSLFFNAGYQKDKYVLDSNAATFNQYNVKSVARQQIDCLAEIALGQVAGADGASNAADCGTGIISANGSISRPLRTPRISIAAGGSYDFKIPAAGIILTPSVNVSYRSSFETGTSNYSLFTGPITVGGVTYPSNPYAGKQITGSQNDGYVLVNAGVAMRTDDNNWTLALECNNCLDTVYEESSLANATYLNPPRTWQVRLKRVF